MMPTSSRWHFIRQQQSNPHLWLQLMQPCMHLWAHASLIEVMEQLLHAEFNKAPMQMQKQAQLPLCTGLSMTRSQADEPACWHQSPQRCFGFHCSKMVSKAVFSEHFWRCYNTLQAAATDEVGVPGYFRFLTLLGEITRLKLTDNMDDNLDVWSDG